MKKLMKKFVLLALKRMARRRLKKFKGKIIGVTGSVGKTSTKDAIFTVLNTKMRVKRSSKSMNSEFGLLLTILDIESGFSSAIKWSWLLFMAWLHSFSKIHAEVLLLEMGVDKPGDMDYLLSVVKPDIAVFTSVAPVHMEKEQFSTLEDIFREKRKMVDALDENGVALLNLDNEFTAELAKKRKGKTITYGFDQDADYRITGSKESFEGIEFLLTHDGTRKKVNANVLGQYHAMVLTPAIICAELVGMEKDLAVEACERYHLPPGRLSLIDGIKETKIIDSTYNSSPEAVKEALKTLSEVGEKSRKVAVLGNMNELGQHSEILHERVGKIVPEHADVLITVGTYGKNMAEAAVEAGMSEENVHAFNHTPEAIDFYKKQMKEGDLILVKGSQNRIRLERFVKEFMLEPERADELLVRQEKVWAKI